MHTKIGKYGVGIMVAVALAIIALGEYSVYSSFKEALYYSNAVIFHLFAVSLFVLPLIYIFTMIVGFRYFSRINSYLYIISAVWLALIIYLFMGSVILALYIWLNYFLNIPISVHAVGISIFAIANILVLYGIINMLIPRIVVREIKSKALYKDWAGKNIVLISDTHLGHIQRSKSTKRLVELIKKQKPDLLLHVGDIIDGPVFNYEKSFRHLETLKPPLGFYYTEGNHERYSRDYKSFRKAFPQSITDLTNSKTIINGTQILGLSFLQVESKQQTKKRIEELGYDSSKPSIVLMHDPKNNLALADMGVSLVLSGHTHGGQFFPDNLILGYIYKSLLYGVTYTNDSVAVTTCGTGTTLIPIRIGFAPEIVVIKIVQ